jgi:dipeptidyl aminopeptidase/acylaminoacyl peptidase
LGLEGLHLLGQIDDGDLVVLGERDGPLHRVHELAHVARPRVRDELARGIRGDAVHRTLRALGDLAEEFVREHEDVRATLAQRWQRDLDDVEAIVEILTEAPLGDAGLEVAVRGRHDANVDVDLAIAADGPHLALLQHAQELGLERERHLADLVEEERALLGLDEEAGARVLRVRERATRVPEELALEEVLGQGPRS